MWQVKDGKVIIDKELTIIDSNGDSVTGRLELKIDQSLLYAWLSKVDIDTLINKLNLPPYIMFVINALKTLVRSKKK